MYENRLLCAWVWWRYKRSISYRIAVVHAQERFTGKESKAHAKPTNQDNTRKEIENE